MKISGYSSVGQSYAATPKKVQQAPSDEQSKSKPAAALNESDKFASSKLPEGVGENVNIKA